MARRPNFISSYTNRHSSSRHSISLFVSPVAVRRKRSTRFAITSGAKVDQNAWPIVWISSLRESHPAEILKYSGHGKNDVIVVTEGPKPLCDKHSGDDIKKWMMSFDVMIGVKCEEKQIIAGEIRAVIIPPPHPNHPYNRPISHESG